MDRPLRSRRSPARPPRPSRPGAPARRRTPSRPLRPCGLPGAVTALAAAASCLLLAGPAGAAAQQQGDGDGGGGTTRYGAFVYAERGGRSMLVAPDTGSTLSEGTRLFFRCSDGRREIYLASSEDRLGSEQKGAGGRYRFGRLPWSELVRWGSNASGSAAFMPPRLAPSFAGRVRESEAVEIQIVNPAGVRHRYVFPLEGFAKGVRELECFTEESDGDGDEDGDAGEGGGTGEGGAKGDGGGKGAGGGKG